MATGLLIRDFNKQERELRYENSGSILLSGIEKNAYRLALTLEITHISGVRYSNLKTLPENTHFGYVTLFRGSTVTDLVPIKFPKFRIFDIRNDAIWHYHQQTELNHLMSVLVAETGLAYHSAHLAITEGSGFGTVRKNIVNWARGTTTPEGAQEYYEAQIVDLAEDESDPELTYRAYPIASPFPDIVKFKSDLPASFLFRLEAWYLVNPVVYIADNPTDDGDETEGENQYPEPQQNEDEDDFPAPSPIPSEADSRDFDDGNIPPPPPPFRGGQCGGKLYRVNVQRSASIAPPSAIQVYQNVPGPIRGIRVESSGSGPNLLRIYYLRFGNPEQEIQLGALFVTVSGQPNNPSMTISSIETMDGSADNCGDPPPVL